jgi:uncharacterized protein YebE (UPF0316 family)
MYNLFFQLGIYFLAGILLDFLITINQRYVIKDKILLAMSTSFFITIMSTIVLYSILSSLDPQRSIPAIIVYASGVAIGTLLAMKSKVG